MIIGNDSVLCKIPRALNRRQALFIEGIRLSIEMADLAHRRLRENLLRLLQPNANPEDQITISVMLDAWSIVDALNRLRGLVKNMPGIQKRYRIPEIRAFFDVTEQIPDLRNTVQHVETTIPGIIDDKNWAVLGSLSWSVLDSEKLLVTTYMFISGTAMGSRPFVNPLKRIEWNVPVDSITIERSGVAVCLSDAMRRVAALAVGLEKKLARTFAEQVPEPQQYQPADVILGVAVSIAPQQIVSDHTPEPEPTILAENLPERESEPPANGTSSSS
jgi:hypothetical protein